MWKGLFLRLHLLEQNSSITNRASSISLFQAHLHEITSLSRNFHERMLDQDLDDVHSVHSIGVVENPLYADQEDYEGPTYAGLQKKEKELEKEGEVRIWGMLF